MTEFPPPEAQPPVVAPARRRAPLAAVGFGLGWVLIAASTAGAVVAFGKDGTTSHTSAAPVTRVTASAQPTTPTVTTTSASPTPAPVTTTPSPTSTVTGTVDSDRTHHGDLRFFLLPVPSDASVVGAADGTALTKQQVADTYKDSSSVRDLLDQMGFKGGAKREYQTGDAKYHVEARLMQFDSAGHASDWFQGDQPNPDWKEFSVPGYSEAKAWAIPPDSPGGLAELRGLYYRGDTVFTIVVTGEDPVDHAVLADRMAKQIDRLTTGASS